jgi:hypothetical protein
VNLHTYSYFSTILISILKNRRETSANDSKNQLSTTAKAESTMLAGLYLFFIKNLQQYDSE